MSLHTVDHIKIVAKSAACFTHKHFSQLIRLTDEYYSVFQAYVLICFGKKNRAWEHPTLVKWSFK
jgi:hypothetical protein